MKTMGAFSFKAGEKIQYSITGDGSGICRLVGAQHSVCHVWHYPHGCLLVEASPVANNQKGSLLHFEPFKI